MPDESDPWDARVMTTVKEAAWLLSLSEHEIRRAVTNGEIDRVFIGAGTANYRVVYGSLDLETIGSPSTQNPPALTR